MGRKKVPESVKWQIIAYFKLNKYTYDKIGSLSGCSKTCVRTTINNWLKTGSVADKIRTGRPRISTPRQDKALFKLSRENPKWSARKLASEWIIKSIGSPDLTIGKRGTVSKRLLEFGLNSYEQTDKQMLTEKDKKNRYEWCVARRNWSYDKWSSILFSDESNFQLVNRKTKATVRRFKHEKYMLMNGTWTFQQDGAPCHKSKLVMRYFEENQIDLLPWCARSPDLNPLEHVWSIIDRKLCDYSISNLGQLEDAVLKEWNNITRETCINLIESMPKRVELCIKARGGYFKY